jgi:hypothetical protein
VAGYGYNGTGASVHRQTRGNTVIPIPVSASYVFIYYAFLNDSGVMAGSSDAGGWIWDATNGTRLLSAMTPTGWSITNGKYDDSPNS